MIAYLDVEIDEEHYVPDRIFISNGETFGVFSRDDENCPLDRQLSLLAIKVVRYVRSLYPDSPPCQIWVRTAREKEALERIYNLSEVAVDEDIPTTIISEESSAINKLTRFVECLNLIE